MLRSVRIVVTTDRGLVLTPESPLLALEPAACMLGMHPKGKDNGNTETPVEEITRCNVGNDLPLEFYWLTNQG